MIHDLIEHLFNTRGSTRERQAASQILLICTTTKISQESKRKLFKILQGIIDWDYLIELAEYYDILPLVAHNLVTQSPTNHLPQSVLERLNRAYSIVLYSNMYLSTELEQVIAAFNKYNIPTIVLKGTVLAELLYENLALRSVKDVDLLVPLNQVSTAISLLIDLGYRRSTLLLNEKHPFHEVPFVKPGKIPIYIEVHRQLDDNRLMTVSEEEIWRRARPVELHGDVVMVLSPEDTLLFQADQYSKNITKLKSLRDVAQILKKYDQSLNWSYIIKSAHIWQIEIPSYYALRQAEMLFGAPVPQLAKSLLRPPKFRKFILNLLCSPAYYPKTNLGEKMRNETSMLVRCLMMRHRRQMLIVLSRYGKNRRGGWLATVGWIFMVFISAIGRRLLHLSHHLG
jgi:hypothetical protein